jgi:hypothetical protein
LAGGHPLSSSGSAPTFDLSRKKSRVRELFLTLMKYWEILGPNYWGQITDLANISEDFDLTPIFDSLPQSFPNSLETPHLFSLYTPKHTSKISIPMQMPTY